MSNFWQDLFASYGATAGGAYEFMDISTLFKDMAGTIPVTAPGDRIALVKDKSGLGHDFAQCTQSSMPIYSVDQQGIGSARFIAANPSFMDGSGMNCDQVVCWEAYVYKSSTGGRILDTRGTGTLGTVKGWCMNAGDGGNINLFTVDDGAGHYLYNDPGHFLPQNISVSLSFYVNGNSTIWPKAVTVGGDHALYLGTHSLQGFTLGDITSSGICRMGAPVNMVTTQCLDGYLYACGSIGAVLTATDRDRILVYLRDIAMSI